MAAEPTSDPGLVRRLLSSLGLWAAEPAEPESAQAEPGETETAQAEPESAQAESESAQAESGEPETAQAESESTQAESESSQAESESAQAEPAESGGARPRAAGRQPAGPPPPDRRHQSAAVGVQEGCAGPREPQTAALTKQAGNEPRKWSGRRAPAGRADKKQAAEPRRPAKKPPMRTARDVISRIQWDRNLPEDYFEIGYLDRFLGVLEKPFGAFTWGDLPWQEYDVLAIPQHRIQHFKYRGVVVWDKASRYDAVFGSSGSSEDIEAAMARIDAEVEAERQRRAEQAAAADDDGDEDDTDDGADLFADSDDDDEPLVEVGFRPAPAAGPAGVPDEERSTHFLAVRVTSDAVRGTVGRVQAAVVAREPELTPCVMRASLLHVTLCMLRLQDREAAAAAAGCVRATLRDLEETLRADDRTLRLRGLRTFGSRVLYAPVAPCSSFSALREALRTRLPHVPGVRLTNAFEYVPHVTLLKVSRPVARARRSRFIDSASYAAHEHTDFGSQAFDNVHLCAIDADCALDGFYVTESSITF